MDVANLPARTADSSVQEPTNFHWALVEAFERGERPAEIAKRLAPTDKKRQKALRSKVWKAVRHDSQLARAVASRTQANLLMALPAAGLALGKQARRRPDAVKLLLEATGLHNPRVQHEHSGEIKVKLDMPRPKFVDAQVEDAEVVEPS